MSHWRQYLEISVKNNSSAESLVASLNGPDRQPELFPQLETAIALEEELLMSYPQVYGTKMDSGQGYKNFHDIVGNFSGICKYSADAFFNPF